MNETISHQLSGKTAFITGASGGIGAAVAAALSRSGVAVSMVSRSGLGPSLPNSLTVAADVRDREAMQGAAERTAEHFGGIDIVVGNAGVGSWAPFIETADRDVQEMTDVNVTGLFNTVSATLPYLQKRGAGDIVTVASEAGRRGLPDEAVYVATKFAQVGFTRSLDHELRASGIRCTNVCPGGVASNFGMGRGLRLPGMPELENMMSPDDVAEVVLFALSRPRHMRILEVAFRHMSEQSWG
ncbi:SDR family oxidoreductase [Arthrobacter globiformis]|uniref:SDR family oxidoreductase n=1 Tax=Arthrobacter globiformis TaxID=1665 RepID=UPI002783EFBF|nr:SDR family oxidoreductase [Arthrobacter globiformis]MDQ0867052.1 NADP-dependent 3-hydroxy acid dehydrogenase YdfG [Arthrobacter globiformis]